MGRWKRLRPSRLSASARAAMAALLMVGLASAAQAVTIGSGGSAPFGVAPLWYNASSAFGLAAPTPAPNYVVGAGDYFLTAGNEIFTPELSITQSLLQPVHQHPQAPADSQNPLTPAGPPTMALPYVADSLWTVRNDSGMALDHAFLAFTFVSRAPFAALPGGYPDILVGMDDLLVDVVKYSDEDTDYYFAAMSLGSMAQGESKQLTVRYIVAGDLPFVGGAYVMPPFGVAGLVTVVPEPASALPSQPVSSASRRYVARSALRIGRRIGLATMRPRWRPRPAAGAQSSGVETRRRTFRRRNGSLR